MPKSKEKIIKYFEHCWQTQVVEDDTPDHEIRCWVCEEMFSELEMKYTDNLDTIHD